jgi:hypothetical protein
MSGAHVIAERSASPDRLPDIVEIKATVQLGAFDDAASFRKELLPHLLYDVPGGAGYSVTLRIPGEPLRSVVSAQGNNVNAFPKNKWLDQAARWLDNNTLGLGVTFNCYDDDGADIIALMIKRQTGMDTRLVAEFKKLLAASGEGDATRELFSRIVRDGPAKVLARLDAAAGEVTEPAPAEPPPDRSPEMVAAMLRDSILGRLQQKFEKGLRDIKLPEGGFTTKEQARAGTAFATTFYRLQKRRAQLGLPPVEKPWQVSDAERMKSDYYAHHTATGEFIPPRPRGRPRKAVEVATSPEL